MDDSRRQYRENDILTASQKKLIVTLYDACLRHLDQAIEQFPPTRARMLISIHKHLQAAQDILTELMATLNFEEGGNIASNLYQLYRYFHRQLTQANLHKQCEPLQAVREQLGSLREAWAQIPSPASNNEPPSPGKLDLRG